MSASSGGLPPSPSPFIHPSAVQVQSQAPPALPPAHADPLFMCRQLLLDTSLAEAMADPPAVFGVIRHYLPCPKCRVVGSMKKNGGRSVQQQNFLCKNCAASFCASILFPALYRALDSGSLVLDARAPKRPRGVQTPVPSETPLAKRKVSTPVIRLPPATPYAQVRALQSALAQVRNHSPLAKVIVAGDDDDLSSDEEDLAPAEPADGYFSMAQSDAVPEPPKLATPASHAPLPAPPSPAPSRNMEAEVTALRAENADLRARIQHLESMLLDRPAQAARPPTMAEAAARCAESSSSWQTANGRRISTRPPHRMVVPSGNRFAALPVDPLPEAPVSMMDVEYTAPSPAPVKPRKRDQPGSKDAGQRLPKRKIYTPEELDRIRRGLAPTPPTHYVTLYVTGSEGSPLERNLIRRWKVFLQSHGVSLRRVPFIHFVDQNIMELHVVSWYVDTLKSKLASLHYIWMDRDPLDPSWLHQADPSSSNGPLLAAEAYLRRLEVAEKYAYSISHKRYVKVCQDRAKAQAASSQYSPGPSPLTVGSVARVTVGPQEETPVLELLPEQVICPPQGSVTADPSERTTAPAPAPSQ